MRRLAGRVVAVTRDGDSDDRLVEPLEAYRTTLHPPAPEQVRGDLARAVDFVTFASPSAARAVAQAEALER